MKEQTILKYHGRGNHLKLLKLTDEKLHRTLYRIEHNRKILWTGDFLLTGQRNFRKKAYELMSQEEMDLLPGLKEAAQSASQYNPINWK